MSIVKYKDSRTGVTYAYESTSYYDPEKKQARPKRKYLGRVDDETGEIITTSRRKKTSDKTDKRISELNEVIAEQKTIIKDLEKRIAVLEKERKYFRNELSRLLDSLDQ